MKDNSNKKTTTTTTVRRLAATVCCIMLSASAFPVGGIPFRQHKSSSISPATSTTTTSATDSTTSSSSSTTASFSLRQPLALEASARRGGVDSSSSASSASSADSNQHHNHNHIARRRSLWSVFSPAARSFSSLKAAGTGISPNITTTATEEEATLTSMESGGLATAFFPALSSLTTFDSPATAAASSTAPTTTVTVLDDRKKNYPEHQNNIKNNHEATSGTTTTERPPPSAHLRLQETAATTTEEEEAQKYKQEKQKKEPQRKNKNNKSSSKSNLKIHTYVDARGRVWKGLNTPRDKFEAFLNYNNIMVTTDNKSGITTHETSTLVDAATAQARRKEWRELWKKGQLLTERTEYLAVYPSDEDKERRKGNNNDNKKNNNNFMMPSKRGGFADLLYLYTQRLLSFLRDEEEDQKSILIWLQKEFGRPATNRLQAHELAKYSPSEQMAYLKEFLEWFRGEFPYYYDRCGSCGASIREDVANNDIIVSDDDATAAADGAADRGHKTFLGYVYPLDVELKGKASRTELYKCHKCDSCTRFPRFNSAWHVMEHKRGRCGEYSMLLYRMMRALGHEARWVVDWADHVWVEVHLDRAGEWIHLDPCEAAVRENYLYQGWGKKQTYVLGFYAPRDLPDEALDAGENEFSVQHTPLIEDITTAYTSDSWEEIQARRDESEDHIHTAMLKSTEQLRERLAAGAYDDL